jgi:hypothetical protein
VTDDHDPASWWCYHFCPECVAERKARAKAELVRVLTDRLWPKVKIAALEEVE